MSASSTPLPSVRVIAVAVAIAFITVAWIVVMFTTNVHSRVHEFFFPLGLTYASVSWLGCVVPQAGYLSLYGYGSHAKLVISEFRLLVLCLEATRLSAATVTFVALRQSLSPRFILTVIAGGVCGLISGLFAFSDMFSPDASVTLSTNIYVFGCCSFCSCVCIGLAFTSRTSVGSPRSVVEQSPFVIIGTLLFAFVGGLNASVWGTGVCEMALLFAIFILGSSGQRILPSCLAAWSVVSVIGALSLGVVRGQLLLRYTPDQIANPSKFHDVFGMWFGLLPIALWSGFVAALILHHTSQSYICPLTSTAALTKGILLFALPISTVQKSGSAILQLGLALVSSLVVLFLVRQWWVFRQTRLRGGSLSSVHSGSTASSKQPLLDAEQA